MIKHDISDRSVVTTCTKCPYWASFSFDVEEAEKREVNHNMLVHEMTRARASDAIRQRHLRAATRRRHAVP